MRSVHSAAAIARAAAARVVARVVAERRYLDTALIEQRRQQPSDASDRALIQELSYGTLRWYHELRGIAELFLTRPLKTKDADMHALLLVGLYQLRHMRIADHAAVDATVEAVSVLGKPWAKGLVNACLRASLRAGGRIDAALDTSEEMRFSHPAWLIAAVRRDYPRAWEGLLNANNQRPPMCLRVNAGRMTRAKYVALLEEIGISASAHPRVNSAVVIHAPVSVERLPGFSDGWVSVQDAAAQLAAVWLDAPPGSRVLDICAAPGGKTAHVLERTPSAEVTALDSDPERLALVRENLTRLGLSAHVLAADATEPAQWWDRRPYDRILIDAPCSATGVIRRHPDIKVRRESGDLPKLLDTQSRILDGVWPCLAPGGKLLYVTCSILSEENALQIKRFLARHPDALAQPVEPGANLEGKQITTGDEDMDGFFYACVHKR
ncbi:MAG TPA: 16S rRNA (cytosine(967)-C(5))-methyltransferase RsmB [Burkholderiales bacterium]|jgi:16S rRNA (cytosine967-C5)-methyltransferase